MPPIATVGGGESVILAVTQTRITNETTGEINSSDHLLKSLIRQVPLFTSGGLGLGLVTLVLVLRFFFGLVYITGLKKKLE